MLQTGAMRRSLLLVVGVLFCGVLATGCMRAEIGVKVDGDGSGTVQLDAYFPTKTLEQRGITEDVLNRIVDGASKVAPAAWASVDLTTIATAGERGVRLTIPFDDHHQVSAAMTGHDPNLSMIKAFSTFDIAETLGGGWTFNGTVDSAGFTATLNELVQQARSAGLQLPGSQLDPASVEVTMTMTLPGDVTKSNSTDVDGGRARWPLTGDHAVTEMSMRTRPAPFDFVGLLIGVAVFVVLVTFVVLLVRRRRRLRRRGDGGAGSGSSGSRGWQPPVGAVPGAGAWGSPPPAASPWGPPTSAGAPAPPVSGPPAGQVPLGGAPGTTQPPPPLANPWERPGPQPPPTARSVGSLSTRAVPRTVRPTPGGRW